MVKHSDGDAQERLENELRILERHYSKDLWDGREKSYERREFNVERETLVEAHSRAEFGNAYGSSDFGFPTLFAHANWKRR